MAGHGRQLEFQDILLLPRCRTTFLQKPSLISPATCMFLIKAYWFIEAFTQPVLDTPGSLGMICGSPGTVKSSRAKQRYRGDAYTSRCLQTRSGAENSTLRRALAYSCIKNTTENKKSQCKRQQRGMTEPCYSNREQQQNERAMQG